jgi:hypothetical protein
VEKNWNIRDLALSLLDCQKIAKTSGFIDEF